jgi:transposase InsO family protein
VTDAAITELESVISAKKACELTGKSRATLYRQRNPKPPLEKEPAGPRAPHPAALTSGEQVALLAVLDSDRFADKAPAQVYAILLDEGIYLASIRTMYRVMTLADQVRERRAQAQHPPRVRPELVADGPDQVWTWDITKLKGPWRGIYFDLYVILDIFSRKVIHWEIHPGESGDLAKAFMKHAIIANGGAKPQYIHADNGTSMTSKTVSDLLTDLKITRSHSRPHVSNDNPFSESAFKTLKYCPVFPGSFETIGDARAFAGTFFTYYNNEHRHSGIGLHTPATVHDGTAWAIREQRQQVLDDAFAARPDRFRGRRPLAPALPAKVWINKPRPTIETQQTQESRQIKPAA